MPDSPRAFVSYSRADSEFALRLTGDLKAAGANVWLDQLDIEPGARWDIAVEEALINSALLLVILSSVSVASDNVRDEVSYALSRQMKIIPVLVGDCEVPFRLARFQRLDFRRDYPVALASLLKTLRVEQQASPPPAMRRTAQGILSVPSEHRRRAGDQPLDREKQLPQPAKPQESRERAKTIPLTAETETKSPVISGPEPMYEYHKDLSPSEIIWLSLKPAKDVPDSSPPEIPAKDVPDSFPQPEIRKLEPSIQAKPPWLQIARYAIVYGTVTAIAFFILGNPHGILLTIFCQLLLGVISGAVLASILRRFKPSVDQKNLRSIVQVWSLSAVVYLILYFFSIAIQNTLLDHPWLSLGLSPHIFVAVISQTIAGAATGFILASAFQRSRRETVIVGLVSFAVPVLVYHWFARLAHIDTSPVDFMFRFYVAIFEAALFLWLIRDWSKLPSEPLTPKI
jgi:hypothetical protein